MNNSINEKISQHINAVKEKENDMGTRNGKYQVINEIERTEEQDKYKPSGDAIPTISDKQEGYTDIPDKINTNGKEYSKDKLSQVNDGLMSGLAKSQKDAEELREKIAKRVETGNIPVSADMQVRSSEDEADPISSLLTQLEDDRKKEEVGVKDDDDIETMLDKIESEKVFVDIKSNEEKTGPSGYKVMMNDEYVQAVEDICDYNNIKVVKKSNTERNAILDRFTNTGNEISMVLVNSGIFIKSTGAGTGEIMAMDQIKANNPALVELTRLQHVCEHITGSTIGRMKVNRLIKVVSHYDKDSLFYALYAGTYPETSELNRVCEKCRREFFMQVKTSDLLLNADEFEEAANYIRNDVTTFEELVDTSELGKVHVKKHSSGMVCYYKHPSIESYVTMLQRLKPEIIQKYSHLVELIYGLDKLAVPDVSGNYVVYSDPNEMIVVISKLKSTSDKYEMLDMINELRPSNVPSYGFKECDCPHCGHKNPQQPFPMEQLLFFQASKEEELAALRWTAKRQKDQKEKKKLKEKK